MFTDDVLQKIKRDIPASKYLEKSKGKLYCCPFCGSGHGPNKSGALELFPDNTFFCHKCRKKGDVIDLLQEVQGVDFKEAVSVLAAEAGIETTQDAPPESAGRPRSAQKEAGGEIPEKETKTEYGENTASYRGYIVECMKHNTETDYFTRRGLTAETIASFMLGYDAGKKAVVIPYPETNYGYFITRSTGGKEFRKPPAAEAGPEPVFNPAALYGKDPCFICESQLDAISIAQAGGSAAAIGGTGSRRIIERLEKRPASYPVILCFDNDEPGRDVLKKTRAALEEIEAPYIVAQFALDKYTGERKDANDLLRADPAQLAQDIAENVKRAKAAHDPAGVKAFLKGIYSDRYRPIKTGLDEIDEILQGGLLPQTLILLGAEPGAGKTALAAMFFESMAATGFPGIFFNLEMAREQLISRSLARRIYAQHSNITLTALDILQGYKLTETERGLVAAAAAEYERETGGRLKYNPGTVGTDLDAILEHINTAADRARAAGDPAPNICIDYLQLLTGQGREDPAEIIKRAVAGFKEYAVKYNAVVFCVIAQGREANKANRPSMFAGRDTSAIEYSADLLLQLVREDPENNPREVTLYINKSRFTKTTPEGSGYKMTLHGGQAFFEMGAAWKKQDGKKPFDFSNTETR